MILRLTLFLCMTAPLWAIFDNWSEMGPFPTQNNLWGVAYGNRTLVAVGEQGTVESFSYDDRIWKLSWAAKSCGGLSRSAGE